MEYEIGKALGCAFGLGILLAAGWFAAYLLSWAWARTWAWIDDSEAPRNNPLIAFSMRSMGWTEKKECHWAYSYYRGVGGQGGEGSDGESGFLYPFFALFFSPMLIVLSIFLYPLTLAAITLYLMARIARFTRRHKKLFDKHIKDPDAHK